MSAWLALLRARLARLAARLGQIAHHAGVTSGAHAALRLARWLRGPGASAGE